MAKRVLRSLKLHDLDLKEVVKRSRAAYLMRVVLDTNVLISAGLKQKSMPAMAVLVVERRGTLLKSIGTDEELFAVMERPYLGSVD